VAFQFWPSNASYGSASASRALDLTAGKLTPDLSDRSADVCGRLWPIQSELQTAKIDRVDAVAGGPAAASLSGPNETLDGLLRLVSSVIDDGRMRRTTPRSGAAGAAPAITLDHVPNFVATPTAADRIEIGAGNVISIPD
jgi:hypothetical protein